MASYETELKHCFDSRCVDECAGLTEYLVVSKYLYFDPPNTDYPELFYFCARCMLARLLIKDSVLLQILFAARSFT